MSTSTSSAMSRRLGGAPDVVAGVLLAGEGVELAADRVDLAGDVARGRAPLGALEEHVLGEVRDPVRLAASRSASRRRASRSTRRTARAASARSARGGRSPASALEDPHRRPWYRGRRGRRARRERRSPRSPMAARRCRPTGGSRTGGRGSPAAARRSTPRRRAATRCDALEFVLAPPEADVLVLVSHEGETPLTLEAARAFAGAEVARDRARPTSPLATLCDEVVVATPEVEESYCHTASYTCAVAALAALRGEDVAWLPGRGRRTRSPASRLPVSEHERWLVAGAGRDWPTAQEAVLKLREGAYVAAEAHQTEQLLHGHLAAVDETVRGFVLEGEGRAAERAPPTRSPRSRARLRRHARPDAPSGRRHRPLPAAHARPRRGPRRRPGPDPPRRPALAAGPRRVQLTRRGPCHSPTPGGRSGRSRTR